MTIGVVVAMSSERMQLDPHAAAQTTAQHGPWRVDRYVIGGKDVIAVTSGIGMANAAAGTEFLIQTERPEIVMNFGCAGAHRRDLVLGDVIIASEVINHALMQILPDGSERYTGYASETEGEHTHGLELKPDPALVELAQLAAAANPPEPWPQDLFWPASVPYRLPNVYLGPVVSADTWTQAHDRLDILHDRHGSLCEEMEAAAVGRVADLHDIPFFAIKDISNNEYLRESDLTAFSDFPIAEVGRRAAALLAQTISLH
jgi:nucleoside phosphorylase